ncbi:Hypothetical protein PAU_03498 [Photorhabdus asymbiotica]|uniref:Uncharacterized protein n=1 Tax=Photorhabdus asymbiotica subsp. asymbiotica (strain ATCC 43949 / 3105-77) TaxID=553480 RepID=C7BK89_PHOAA|nr:Hypothetical protein PAU_03498 [Photorhabdus asymbiotica]
MLIFVRKVAKQGISDIKSMVTPVFATQILMYGGLA